MVEEFSMLSARLYELLEEVARLAKGSTAVFGGVRLIFVGDVAQLSPVPGWSLCFLILA